MPFLSQIVCKINNTLSTTSLTAGLIDGIAYQVTRKTDAGDQLFPAIFDGGLVEKYIGIDDSNSTIVYHRQIRNTYRKNQQIPNRYTQTTQMLMVVYGNKNLLQVQTPDALESLIIKSFPTRFEPEQLTGLEGLDDVNVSVVGSEMNPATVFAGEYRNVPYRLSPDEIYFSISYTLDIQFDNNCLEECNPSPPDSLCDFIELATAQQIIACLTPEQEGEIEVILCGACEDATAVLKNTALTTISTTTIASGATTNINAPDATAVIKNSLGTTLDTEAIPSNVSENIIMPDVNNVDSDGSVDPTPAGVAYTCTPQVKTLELTFGFEATDDTSFKPTNAGTTWTLTAISDDGASGTITVSVNEGAYAAFVNPTVITNGQKIQVKRTTTTSDGWVLITGTYA